MEIGYVVEKAKSLLTFLFSTPPYLYALGAGIIVFVSYIAWRLGLSGWGPLKNLGPVISDRWADLELQLVTIKKSAEKLAHRLKAPTDLDEIVSFSLRSLREIYWDIMRNPLTKIVVAASSKGQMVTKGIPFVEVSDGELGQFLVYLKETASLASPRPFCGLDIERVLAYSLEIPKPENLVFINKFMMDNNFEFCFPCYKGADLNGAIFLGSKRRGIFWPQELRALQMISHQTAIAVDKGKPVSLKEAIR